MDLGRSLPSPEERLVDDPLRDVSLSDFQHHRIDKRQLALEPRFESYDQPIAQRNFVRRRRRYEQQRRSFSRERALHYSSPGYRREDNCQTQSESDEAHVCTVRDLCGKNGHPRRCGKDEADRFSNFPNTPQERAECNQSRESSAWHALCQLLSQPPRHTVCLNANSKNRA